MKILLAVLAGMLPFFITAVASAQGGNMMSGDGWGMGWMSGYGLWGPILLVVAVAGVAALLLRRRGK